MMKREQILSLLFCATLAVGFGLFWLLPKADVATEERRYLAEPPTLSVTNILDGTFAEECEDYLSDHFPGRKWFVGTYSYYRAALGRGGESGVYNGKDGFLFALPARDDVLLKENVEAINTFAAAVDCSVQLMAVPAAGAVIDDALPALHLNYSDEEQLRTVDDLLSDDVQRLPLETAFLSAPDPHSLYFKTDHHWTSAGAYLAYTLFCEEKGIRPLAETDFEREVYPGFYGTNYARSGLWLHEADTLELWRAPIQWRVEIHDDQKDAVVEAASPFFPAAFDGEDPYDIYFDGNHSLVRMTNEAVATGKLLLIKDSYANAFAPFLSAHYRDVYLLDLRYAREQKVSDLIREEDIDEVLFLYSLAQLCQDHNFLWLK